MESDWSEDFDSDGSSFGRFYTSDASYLDYSPRSDTDRDSSLPSDSHETLSVASAVDSAVGEPAESDSTLAMSEQDEVNVEDNSEEENVDVESFNTPSEPDVQDYNLIVSTSETENQEDDNTLEYEPISEQGLPEVDVLEAARQMGLFTASTVNHHPTTSSAREHSPDGPPAKIRKRNRDEAPSEPEDDGATCSICLDAWSTSGEHRIVALKCGHLFGRSCVLRWLASQPVRERRCPTCKARAAQRDIRCIYARKLIAADTAEIDALKRQLDATESEKVKVQLELQRTQLKQRMYEQQLTDMRALMENLKSSSCTERGSTVRWHFMLAKSLEVANDASCRALAYNSRKYELYASQKSTTPLFPGYGIRKIDCVHFKPGAFVSVHPKPIRDMQYSPATDLLASVALDGAAKLICGQTGQVASTIRTEMPLWSCCWERTRANELLVGGPGGVTLLYDTRNPSQPLERLTVPGDVSPVVSLASTPYGFLSCHLNSCWFYRRVGAQHHPSMLPFDGPFLSLSYEEQSRNILVSCRPSTGYRNSRHIVAHLDLSGDATRCNTVHTFPGSSVQTLMSRSCQMRLGSEDWIAAHNETAASVALFSTNSFKLEQSLGTQDPVVDMCAMNFNGNHFLATLSQNKTRIYKANNASC